MRVLQAGVDQAGRLLWRVRECADDLWDDPTERLGLFMGAMRWRRGAPADRGLAEADKAACKALRCPKCEMEWMDYGPFVREWEGREEYRAFGLCRVCGPTTELATEWLMEWRAGEMSELLPGMQEAAEPHVAARTDVKTPAKAWHAAEWVVVDQVGGASDESPGAYYDELMKQWYRPNGRLRALVVAGPEDRSRRQVRRFRECWACDSEEPHSTAYHDEEMRLIGKMWTSTREREDGWLVTTMLAEPLHWEDEEEGGGAVIGAGSGARSRD